MPTCAADSIIAYNQTAPAGCSLYPAGKLPGAEIRLPFRKKVLYYGLMLLLTLLASEGMARIAYYAAYGVGVWQRRGGGYSGNYPLHLFPIRLNPSRRRSGIPFTGVPGTRPTTP